MNTLNAPLKGVDAPDPVESDLEPLLAEPFASAWAAAASGTDAASRFESVRRRLLDRLAASRAAERTMTTARRSRLQPGVVAPGVRMTLLYAADPGRPGRPGEPLRACLVELSPRSAWIGPAPGAQREWLVLRGALALGALRLAQRDYHVDPAGSPGQPVASDAGALVFLRESALAADAGDAAFTVRDQDAGWPDFAPGIQRRVLWQRGGQAALLYCAQPGARIPHHRHAHDEECLMVEGELFLDDVLLQPGDYQLAPAGSGHHITETDTGVVIYAHGDLDLRFVA